MLSSPLVLADPIKFDIKGEAAILMNADTGSILFEQEAYTPKYPASTTKIGTAIYAMKLKGSHLEMQITAEQDSLGTITQEKKRKSNYTIPGYRLEPDGVHIGIKKGEVLSLRDLMGAMLIHSACDASNVIAQALGPTIPTFMDGLNAYLKEIGCQKTHFVNPHGLHDPKHESTAYDLALMARVALKSPVISQIVLQTRFLRPKTNKQQSTTYLQTNRLIRPGKFFYQKAIGVKTGYHAKAKRTLVAAARSDGRTLIAVLLGYQDRNAIFEDAKKLFETAFNQPKIQKVYLREGMQSFTQTLSKADNVLQTYLSEPLTLEFYPAEDPKAKCLLYWQIPSLPILRGQQVGLLQLVSAKGDLLKQVPLLSGVDVDLSWPYNWISVLLSHIWEVIGVLGCITAAFLGLLWKKAR